MAVIIFVSMLSGAVAGGLAALVLMICGTESYTYDETEDSWSNGDI